MILFLDDESSSNPFLKELSNVDLPITVLRDVEEAWRFLLARPDTRVMVLDVMMPPGTFLGLEETDHGLLTGVLFYKKVRERFPTLPIFVISNNRNPAIAAALQGDTYADLSAKPDVWADEFASKVAHAYRQKVV